MDEMDSITAPQWMDFIDNCSPQIPMPDYFEKEHEIHGHIMEFCDSTSKSVEDTSSNMTCVKKETEIQNLNVIEDVSVKVISPKYRNKTKIEEFTSDQVLNSAMKKLQLCAKQIKTQEAINKSIQDGSVNFKTPSKPVAKSSRSIICYSTGGLTSKKFVQLNTTPRYAEVKKYVCTPQISDNTTNDKKVLSKCLFEPEEPCEENKALKNSSYIIQTAQDYDSENEKKVNEEYVKDENKVTTHDKLEKLDDNKDNKQEQDNVTDIDIKQYDQAQPLKQRTTVLTWQNGKRSLNKRRISNRFISLAEAVSRFQNDTPKRFRTKCKDPAGTANNPTSKPITLQQRRLLPTIPVSPALLSKNRKRMATVLSKEEREKQELMEMKKHQVKANPIKANILQRSVRPVSKNIDTKKKTTASKISSSISCTTQLSKETPSTDSIHSQKFSSKNLEASRQDKTLSLSKNIVTKVLVTDPKGVIVDQEEITYFGVPKSISTVKSTTRILPFSFEARNKDLQMKKEQRLKDQEASKTKTEFHAKPAPNFSKTMLPLTTKQPTEKKKKIIALPCPFSFEARDKNLAKKKEEFVKQVLEEDKRSRIFRAKPAPVFKPVMVRGVSMDRLSMKEKVTKTENAVVKYNDQENKEPNIVAAEEKQESKYTRKAKSVACIAARNKTMLKDKERKVSDIKMILPFKLNTDKRAKERREFNEKVKRKEIEEEIKYQELNKERLVQEKHIKPKLCKTTEEKTRPILINKPLIES